MMKFHNKTIFDFSRLAAILSGVLLALSYRFDFLWWMCLFALVPLFIMLLERRRKMRDIFRITMVFCLSYYIITMLWLFELVPVLNDVTGSAGAWIIMALATITVSVIMGLAHCLPMLLFSRLRRARMSDCLILPVLYVSGEFLIGCMGDLAFPWGRLANIAVPCLPFVQGAALFGGMFVSLIIALTNALAAFGLLALRDRKRRLALASVCCAVCLTALNLGGGAIRMAVCKPEADTGVLIVQGNFPSNSKWSSTVDKMLDKYLSLSQDNISADTKLVVWPETAIPVDLNKYPSYGKRMSEFTMKNNVTLVVGTILNTIDGSYNVMQLIYPDGTISKTYAKQLLVPMGEYTPLKEVIGIILPGVLDGLVTRDLLHGRETVIFETPYGALNGIICYESIQPYIQLRATSAGSGLITMITNDSWFGTSAALRQHLSHAQLRAVENYRYLARSGNSGITAFISPCGEILSSLPTYESGALSGSVAFINERTLYSVIGDLPIALLLLACIILFILDIIKSYKVKKCRIASKNPANSSDGTS